MKRCLALMMCLMTSQLNAGLQRQTPATPIDTQLVDSAKKAYTKEGNVDLEPLLDLKVGDIVAFKAGEEIVVGTVAQRSLTPDDGLKIFGTFTSHTKAGFLFHFGPGNTVKGVLFFVDRNVTYNLAYNEATKQLVFERRELTLRELPPSSDVSASK